MEQPTLQALVLADHIYTDRGTGKRTICGPFNRIAAENFGQDSALPFAPWAYIVMTGLKGEYDLVLQYVDLKDNRLLLRSPIFRVKSENPLRNFDLAIQIPNLPLWHPGVYALELCWNEQLIGSIRIPVIEKGKGESS